MFVALVVVVVVAILGFVLVGRSGKNSSAGNVVALARYCELAKEFDGLFPNTSPAAGPVVTPAAITRLFDAMDGTIQEMEADAPAAVHSDVVATVKILEQAKSGDSAGVRSSSFMSHHQRISTFREKTCPAGTGTNDQ